MKNRILIDLKPYTNERCHEFYKSYQPDPLMTYDEFAYNPESIERYFKTKVMDENRRFFAIVHEDRTIGEIQLKYIDFVLGYGTLSIIVSTDEFKNCGVGTEAIKMMLQYAKDVLKLNGVYADAIHRNSRSQYVLERIGFKYEREDEILKYYKYNLKDN